MALLGWVLVLELAAAYGLAALRPPVDSIFLLTWGLAGLAAGWYGLAGNYWQRITWLLGLAWYTSQLARYVGIVEPVAAASPGLPAALGLLYVVALPIAWMVSLGALVAWGYLGSDDGSNDE